MCAFTCIASVALRLGLQPYVLCVRRLNGNTAAQRLESPRWETRSHCVSRDDNHSIISAKENTLNVEGVRQYRWPTDTRAKDVLKPMNETKKHNGNVSEFWVRAPPLAGGLHSYPILHANSGE